jgi:hypothetical protein
MTLYQLMREFNCSNNIEDELHVKCPLYLQIREALYIDIH